MTSDFENLASDFGLADEWESLSPAEKQLLEAALEDPEVYDVLLDVDFKNDPVPPQVFFQDEYYVGKGTVWNDDDKTGLFPLWYQELCHVLDPKNKVHEWIISGALGCGKTTVALLLCAYKVYYISCLRNPPKYLGIGSNSTAEFMFLTLNLLTAGDVLSARFETLIGNSKYFRENFPIDRRRRFRKSSKASKDSDWDFKLEFPPYISMTEGSQGSHMISRDVIFGLMDEANFMEKTKAGLQRVNYSDESRAYTLYAALRRRILSRFLRGGEMLGMMVLISSSASDNMFLEQHKLRSRSNPHVYISEWPIWVVQPWRFSKDTFRVQAGSHGVSSKFLEPGDVADNEDLVIDVPVELREDFEKDLPQAIRDFAGRSTEVVNPLIPMRDQIINCYDETRKHPFKISSPKIGHLGETNELIHLFEPELITRWEGQDRFPIHNPGASRFVHGDLSKSDCATGLAMGCISEYRTVKKKDRNGAEFESRVPIVSYDFLLQIMPPDAPERIGYKKILEFIVYLRDVLHFPIKKVTFDGYNSEYILQVLESDHGFETKLLSIDRHPETYTGLASGVMEERVSFYNYEPFVWELESIQKFTDGKKTIIDHGPGGSKDVSDCAAGVFWHCIQSASTELAPEKIVREDEFEFEAAGDILRIV